MRVRARGSAGRSAPLSVGAVLADERRRLGGDDGQTCLTDATSRVGLAALRRRYPGDWPGLLRCAVSPEATPWLLERLVRGQEPDLLPRSVDDRTFEARRSTARRLVASLADRRVGSLDEHALHELAQELTDSTAGAPSRIRRDLSLLRRWVRRAQLALGLKPRVHARWPRVPLRAAPETTTFPPELADVAAALRRCRAPDVRAMIGLAVGARLSTKEFEGLRWSDVDGSAPSIGVRDGDRRGTPRRSAGRTLRLPRWTWDLLDAWRRHAPKSEWVFPDPRDPRRHRTQSDGRLRSLRRRLGNDSLTFASLRALGQAVARDALVCRAGVRGSVSNAVSAGEALARQVEQEQDALAEAWRVLRAPPVAPRPLPLRAPSGCAPSEPELVAARRRVVARFGAKVPPLPESCLVGSASAAPALRQTWKGGADPEGPAWDDDEAWGATTGASGRTRLATVVGAQADSGAEIEREVVGLRAAAERARDAEARSRAALERQREEAEIQKLLAFGVGAVAGVAAERILNAPELPKDVAAVLKALPGKLVR